MRATLRQSLSDVVDIAVDRTSDFVRSAQADLENSGQSSELLQRLSSIPVKFDAEGEGGAQRTFECCASDAPLSEVAPRFES